MIQRHLVMRGLKAASHVRCALGVTETLRRRDFKRCANLLVVVCFPKTTAPNYDFLVSVDGRR